MVPTAGHPPHTHPPRLAIVTPRVSSAVGVEDTDSEVEAVEFDGLGWVGCSIDVGT